MPEIIGYTKAGADAVFETKTNANNLYLRKSDTTETVQDIVGAMLVSGGTLTLAYDDNAGKVTITGTGADAELVRDTIGAALIGSNGLTVAVNDAADTITLSLDSSVVKTTDSRLSNARTPTVHASTHATGGSDPITPASIGALAANGKAADADLLDGLNSTDFARSNHSHFSTDSVSLVGANSFTLSNGRFKQDGNAKYLGFKITTPNQTFGAGEHLVGTTNQFDPSGDIHGTWTFIGTNYDFGGIVIASNGNIYCKHNALGLTNMPLGASVSWIS